jgi:hypothetical protein
MTNFRVRIVHQVTEQLAGPALPAYLSPPHSEAHARQLIAVKLGHQIDGQPGPWREATAGGQWLIELLPEP